MLHFAWRNLTQNRTQFLVGVGGVILAIVLMLALDALLTGMEDDLVAYIEQSGADLFLAQEDVRNMHMTASAITWRDLRQAARAQAVTSASPILYATGVYKVGQVDILSVIIGFDPDEPLGGPRIVLNGTQQLKREEAIIDEAIARAQGVRLGDEVEIFGDDYKVVGLTRGLTNITSSFAFIALEDFRRARGDNALSYGLLTVAAGADVDAVAQAIMARNDKVMVLPRAQFALEERKVVRDMTVEMLYIMNGAGLLIGLAFTALTLYMSTLHKRAEYGVLKAIGASNRQLYAAVATQAVVSVALGAAGAVAFVWLLGQLLPLVTIGISMRLTQTGIIRVLAASFFIGVAGALTPAWQLARLDPAQVFRK
jgi:putative ABC transport system permease protein